jgi:hypothetical protein
MRLLKLDFLHPYPGTGWPAWLLLAAGLALSAWVGWHDRQLDQAISAESAKKPRQASSTMFRKAGSMPVAAGQAETQSASEQLALSWNGLFAGLEKVQSRHIALLALEADGRKPEATLTAEARTLGDMLAYIDKLESEAGFRSVTLSSHVLQEEDPQHPYRFVLRLGWRH